MTTYKRIEVLTRCLASLRKTKFPEKTRLIITDDNSQDPLVIDALHDFVNNPPQNLETELRIRPTNLGCDASVVESVQYAFTQTQEDWVIVQDSDGIFHPEWFNVFMEFKGILDSHYPKYALSVWNPSCHPTKGPASVDPRLIERESIAGFNLLIQREIFKDLQVKAWDWSYVWKCISQGAPMFTTQKSWVHHFGFHGTHISPDVTLDFMGEKLLHL